MTKEKRTPLLFVGHGNPMNAIDDNIYTREWEIVGKKLSPPKAIVCMSAHWLTTGSFVTSSLKPEIIYDFYGFPEKLYHVSYSAKGSPQLASEIHDTNQLVQIDTQRGLDHGTWTVLKRMFPSATIPVLQISIDYSADPKDQFELMNTLRELRNKNILFLGSGNIVHNLGLATENHNPYDWALEFEEKSKLLIEKGDKQSLIKYKKLGQSAKMSIPTDDHYRPMLNTLALKYDDENPTFFNQGIDLASISMLSFIFM